MFQDETMQTELQEKKTSAKTSEFKHFALKNSEVWG